MHANPDQTGALAAFQELLERDLLSVVFEDAPTQIFVLDAATRRFAAANGVARKSIDISLAKLSQMQLSDLLPRLDPVRANRVLEKLCMRPCQRARFVVQLDNDTDMQLEITMLYVAGSKPSFLIFVGDLSAPYRAVATAHHMLETAIEALPDAFVLYDSDDRLVVCNQRYREFYPRSAPAMVPGIRFEDLLRFGLEKGEYAEAVGREDEWLRDRMSKHLGPDTQIEQHLNSGRWLRIMERRTKDGGRVGMRVDITQIKFQQEELDRLSRVDDLTGLFNRRGLTIKLESLMQPLPPDSRLVLLQIDLDRFKKVNDLSGYEAGDRLLQQTGQILSDWPLGPEAVGRVGGDEFMVALRCTLNDTELVQAADALSAKLSEPKTWAGRTMQAGASIGIATLRPETKDPIRDMLSAADIALSIAKQSGGNGAVLFQQSMLDDAVSRTGMAKELMLGLTRNEFEPFFQPQIDTKTGQIIGFEALIRWQHPTKGFVPAFQFLDIAQGIGLTEALDDIVMDRSCHAARQLLDWGMAQACVSINMSVAQISDPTIVARLETHMVKHGITSKNIRIELLESTLLDKRSVQIIRNVHALIAAGFPIELDDFGTGHAAIATLREFAVSCIKIDRSLVRNIHNDAELQVITETIIHLARRLGIEVLAEGVETDPEQETLQKMGCHRAQGYLHARPMALSQVRDFLKLRSVLH